ncbi:MAG: class I SAM-dependent methyltransferase [Arenicellales bacterium]
MPKQTTQRKSDHYYRKHYRSLCQQYDALQFEQVHKDWIGYLSLKPGKALDVGAGSGRDARWLADHGWQVLAVEPCDQFRDVGSKINRKEITWLGDKLPELKHVPNKEFNFILASAVWMHLDIYEQKISFQRMIDLLDEEGLLVITWRNQGHDAERTFQHVDESIFRNSIIKTDKDSAGRSDVVWKCAIIKKPRS